MDRSKLLNSQYSVKKNISFKITILGSDLCDYSDAYKGAIDLLAAATNKNDKDEINISFKNNATFRSCISKLKVHW